MGKSFKLKCLLVCLPLLFTSCASIVSGRNYSIRINSNPNGANFEILNKRTGYVVESGVTPKTVRLPAGSPYFKKNDYIIKYSMPGYDESTEYVNSGIDGWYWVNFAIGGLIGMVIVDPLTGAMYRIPVEYVDTTLNKTTKK